MKEASAILLLVITLLLNGCAGFDRSMAGDAVDIPDDPTPPPQASALH